MKHLLSRSSLIEPYPVKPDDKDEQGYTASDYVTHSDSVDLRNTFDQWPGKDPGYVARTKSQNV